ncbi:hypothetical protein AX774_g3953 [Zancudomyces culisetae]|uniref:Uncharacterized protein n=1 Tax=Zancudomyces culisetae TaxID=1213189 RepID=A0A1R1PNL5_ZANCU|nr:hypothetical protein AX774_g3953 [Zancudomyces culisetae]|eukprot:OMH82565.1 hypothetical protein AX774_g3953 [Zancudomyces culisetae]
MVIPKEFKKTLNDAFKLNELEGGFKKISDENYYGNNGKKGERVLGSGSKKLEGSISKTNPVESIREIKRSGNKRDSNTSRKSKDSNAKYFDEESDGFNAAQNRRHEDPEFREWVINFEDIFNNDEEKYVYKEDVHDNILSELKEFNRQEIVELEWKKHEKRDRGKTKIFERIPLKIGRNINYDLNSTNIKVEHYIDVALEIRPVGKQSNSNDNDETIDKESTKRVNDRNARGLVNEYFKSKRVVIAPHYTSNLNRKVQSTCTALSDQASLTIKQKKPNKKVMSEGYKKLFIDALKNSSTSSLEAFPMVQPTSPERPKLLNMNMLEYLKLKNTSLISFRDSNETYYKGAGSTTDLYRENSNSSKISSKRTYHSTEYSENKFSIKSLEQDDFELVTTAQDNENKYQKSIYSNNNKKKTRREIVLISPPNDLSSRQKNQYFHKDDNKSLASTTRYVDRSQKPISINNIAHTKKNNDLSLYLLGENKSNHSYNTTPSLSNNDALFGIYESTILSCRVKSDPGLADESQKLLTTINPTNVGLVSKTRLEERHTSGLHRNKSTKTTTTVTATTNTIHKRHSRAIRFDCNSQRVFRNSKVYKNIYVNNNNTGVFANEMFAITRTDKVSKELNDHLFSHKERMNALFGSQGKDRDKDKNKSGNESESESENERQNEGGGQSESESESKRKRKKDFTSLMITKDCISTPTKDDIHKSLPYDPVNDNSYLLGNKSIVPEIPITSYEDFFEEKKPNINEFDRNSISSIPAKMKSNPDGNTNVNLQNFSKQLDFPENSTCTKYPLQSTTPNLGLHPYDCGNDQSKFYNNHQNMKLSGIATTDEKLHTGTSGNTDSTSSNNYNNNITYNNSNGGSSNTTNTNHDYTLIRLKKNSSSFSRLFEPFVFNVNKIHDEGSSLKTQDHKPVTNTIHKAEISPMLFSQPIQLSENNQSNINPFSVAKITTDNTLKYDNMAPSNPYNNSDLDFYFGLDDTCTDTNNQHDNTTGNSKPNLPPKKSSSLRQTTLLSQQKSIYGTRIEFSPLERVLEEPPISNSSSNSSSKSKSKSKSKYASVDICENAAANGTRIPSLLKQDLRDSASIIERCDDSIKLVALPDEPDYIDLGTALKSDLLGAPDINGDLTKSKKAFFSKMGLGPSSTTTKKMNLSLDPHVNLLNLEKHFYTSEQQKQNTTGTNTKSDTQYITHNPSNIADETLSYDTSTRNSYNGANVHNTQTNTTKQNSNDSRRSVKSFSEKMFHGFQNLFKK